MEIELQGPPMHGKCSSCGVNLELAAQGLPGHVCFIEPTDHVVLALTPDVGSPTIDLIRCAGRHVQVFAKLVEPQPPGLPPGLVLIEMPDNAYLDPNAR